MIDMFTGTELNVHEQVKSQRPLLDNMRQSDQSHTGVVEMNENPPPVDDRRLHRTRSALRDALVTLVIERGWDDLSVQDLCDRANVGRSTFYTHYPNKDALLVGTFDDLRRFLQSLPPELLPTGSPPRFSFALGLIKHADERRKVFQALLGRRSGYTVKQRFRDMVIQLVADELPNGSTHALPRGAAERWIAGGMVELLIWWIEQPDRVSPAELALTFEEMAGPIWSYFAAHGEDTADACATEPRT